MIRVSELDYSRQVEPKKKPCGDDDGAPVKQYTWHESHVVREVPDDDDGTDELWHKRRSDDGPEL